MSEPYRCANPAMCKKCGVTDNPLGFHDGSGNFIQRCQLCNHEWVAISAEEAEKEAKARMDEAQEVLDPALRAFFRGRSRPS